MKLRPLAFAITSIIATSSFAADELDTVMVNGDFRSTSIEETTSSVTVINQLEMQKRSAKHLENVLNLAPNVNSSAGASRAQYFQIRGIGETGQFVSSFIPSVGLNIDGIDYSRTGAAGSLFDMKQVEVLRGPQGTRFGANALAGMIILESNEPTEQTEIHYEQTLGNFNSQSTGVAIGGALIEKSLLGRLSVHKHQSDGYMENTFLKRKDTQNQDEVNATAQLRWFANDKVTFDLKAKHFDKDNGYDAFNFDSDYTTQSDEPGKDTLLSDAYSLKATIDINPKIRMESILTKTHTDIEYSYDEDWSYVGYNPDEYSSFDQYLRSRNDRSMEVRFLSSDQGRIFNNTTDWVGGIYQSKQNEGLVRNYTYLSTPFKSQYNTTNIAAYGQLDHHLNSKVTLSTGLRLEQFKGEYQDSENIRTKTDELLYGGKLGVQIQANEKQQFFASLSRGYKAGGVNPDGRVSQDLINFDTEYLWNLEAGLNSSLLNDKLKTRLTAFYSLRKDQQVKTSDPVLREDGSTDYIEYLGNAAEGRNLGLEADLNWKLSNKFTLLSSLGLLKASFTDYSYQSDTNTLVNFDGREQPQSPSYQYSIGGELALSQNLVLSANIEGKDSYYFSTDHDFKSQSFNLVNASLEYLKGDWTITLWSRNLLDKAYETRGFGSFGNDPADGYTTNLYTQKGEPRTFGLSVAWDY